VRELITSGLPEAQYARNVIRAGASGYLPKSGDPRELLKTVHLVLSARRYVSTALAEAMADDLKSMHDQTLPMHSQLSTREFQIFCRLAVGTGVSAIAGELGLNVKTVSTHRSRILEKMHFTSNADITGYAIRQELMP